MLQQSVICVNSRINIKQYYGYIHNMAVYIHFNSDQEYCSNLAIGGTLIFLRIYLFEGHTYLISPLKHITFLINVTFK